MRPDLENILGKARVEKIHDINIIYRLKKLPLLMTDEKSSILSSFEWPKADQIKDLVTDKSV